MQMELADHHGKPIHVMFTTDIIVHNSSSSSVGLNYECIFLQLLGLHHQLKNENEELRMLVQSEDDALVMLHSSGECIKWTILAAFF